MKFKLILSSLVLPLSMLASHAQAESVSCVLENNKVLTVSHLHSAPTYSYGTAGKVELTLPSGAANSRVYKGTQMFNGGGAQYLAFTNGAYTYTVYDGMGRGWEFYGLRVYKNADIILEKQCKQMGGLQFDFDAVNAPEAELPYE